MCECVCVCVCVWGLFSFGFGHPLLGLECRWTGMATLYPMAVWPANQFGCQLVPGYLAGGAATDVCHVILQVVCTAGLEASESVMLHHLHFWACTICSCAAYFLL